MRFNALRIDNFIYKGNRYTEIYTKISIHGKRHFLYQPLKKGR